VIRQAGEADVVDQRLEPNPDARRRCLTFVVGGGATGVELISAIRTLVGKGLERDYPSVDPAEPRLVLTEATPQLLGGMDPWLGETAARHLRQSGSRSCSMRR
jgi:NADH dehydrogenase